LIDFDMILITQLILKNKVDMHDSHNHKQITLQNVSKFDKFFQILYLFTVPDWLAMKWGKIKDFLRICPR